MRSRPNSEAGSAVEFFNLFWRRKMLLIGTVVLVTGFSVMVAFQITPRYTANARLMIGKQNVTPAGMGTINRMLGNDLRSHIYGEIEVMRSDRLIERAVDVAACLANAWRCGEQLGTNEHSIKLLELLNELLAGVVGSKTPSENEICHKVADLYVFLSKHLVQAETSSDVDSIDEIKAVLEVEAETWRAACAQTLPSPNRANLHAGGNHSGRLNLEA